MKTDNQPDVLDEVINWRDLFKNFISLQNTLLNVYDIESEKFVHVQIPANNFLGLKPGALHNMGLQAWTDKIAAPDRKKCDEFLFEHRNFSCNNLQILRHCLNYRIQRSDGHLINILHEQRILKKNEEIFVLNLINDLTETKSINDFLDKTSLFPYQDFQFTAHEKKPVFVEISRREQQVLRLIASGLSSREIAECLFISNHTAITHRKNLIHKFHVSNTAELIKEASKVIWLG